MHTRVHPPPHTHTLIHTLTLAILSNAYAGGPPSLGEGGRETCRDSGPASLLDWSGEKIQGLVRDEMRDGSEGRLGACDHSDSS